VICAGCGFAAPPDSAFCPKCGNRLPWACPACGKPCPPDFAFCPRCGKSPAPAPPRRRRHSRPIAGQSPSSSPICRGSRPCPSGSTPRITEDQKGLLPPRDFNIHAGHFLIDKARVVRWVQIETPADDLSRYGMFPRDDEILAAARAAGV